MASNNRTKQEKVIKQIVEGHELATQLRLLISKPVDDQHRYDPTRIPCGSDSGSAEELLAKILRSFDKALLTLNSFQPVTVPLPSTVEGSRNTSCQDSAALECYDRRYEDSGDSRKRLGLNNKGKRGCYKRKRKSETWIVESATLEDAHAWRKYGQKKILNEKYPRSYFRCTHKKTLGCNATRQVQKPEDNPTIFQITYIGSHTCAVNNLINQNSTKINPAAPLIIMDTNSSVSWSSYIDKKNITTEKGSKVEGEDNSTSVSVKGEETSGVDVADDHQDLSLVWNDFMAFEESEMMYCSGETSSHGLGDMDFMVSFLEDGELSF